MLSVKTELDIRFNDIDVAGHVHNAVYFEYFEIGRIDLFKKIAGNEWNWKERGVLVARNESDYLKPVLLNDKIFIETRCQDVGKKSITLSYQIFKESTDGVKELCTRGRSILVCADAATGKSVEVYEEWKAVLLSDG